jgi:acetolactate synthase-1/2/3 large subunit
MIKVSDYIVRRLVERGIRHVFMVTGGGAMHLNDSVGRCRDLEYVCTHHEQGAAIAAEGYQRAAGRLAAVLVTSGPGGTNTLTGVIGQWLDSIPVLYLSGQVRFSTTIDSCRSVGLRQLGDQEINIVDIVRPVTKSAATVRDPLDIRRLLDEALALAEQGRPGPVWLDIPLDVQGAYVSEQDLRAYEPAEGKPQAEEPPPEVQAARAIEWIQQAERPVMIAGHGIRISGGEEAFSRLAEVLQVPVLCTFNGFDLVPGAHPLYIGRIGTIGDRAGNFALQNADLVLSLGTRNNIRQIGFLWKRIVVDIDRSELQKPTFPADLPVRADVGMFMEALEAGLRGIEPRRRESWLAWCRERKARYPVVPPSHAKEGTLLNPYFFMDALSSLLGENAVVVTGNGTASVAYFQAGIVKAGQRVIWNSGCAAMGYDLPAAVGACFALGKKDVVCLAGDGSLMMNIQELATVAHHRLPLKIFVLNNQGYSSIRQTQDAYFGGHHVGCGPASGLTFPEYSRIAEAHGLPYDKLDSPGALKEGLPRILQKRGPVLCEVLLDPEARFAPKAASQKLPDGRIVSKPLEDMFPFLDRDELAQNMVIPLWESGSDRMDSALTSVRKQGRPGG